jgi:hypothetical protein
MSVGLINWVRSFTYDQNGAIIRNQNGPVFAAHPQPNLWSLIAANAKSLAESFDLIQLPPASHGYGEGYSPFELRDLNSNWGAVEELIAAVTTCHAAGMLVSTDLPFRQMSGANGGPGVFLYDGRPGETTASWFQFFNNPGETLPPFVPQDSVPNAQGNYAFGTVRSYENCIPAGVVEADTTDVLATMINTLGLIPGKDIPRWDDGKGMHAPSCLRIMNSQPSLDFYVEYFSGNPAELDWYVRDVMQNRCAVEDYAQYWHTQNACNGYDARQFDAGGGGYWRWNSAASIGFVNNPDVATSWSATGGISQQIAFNLLLAYAHGMCLPYKEFLVYAEDYFPSSPDYPTGRGLKVWIDNLCWFSRTFAFGNFEKRWEDKDVYAYTRDGNGGSVGWSGGCLVAINFNTLNPRTITVQTPWPEGEQVHNYSATGHNEDYTVGPGGRLTVTVQSNYFSGGQSYLLIAPGGVNHPVKMHPIAA